MQRFYALTLCGLAATCLAAGTARAHDWTSAREVARAAHIMSGQAEHFHEVVHDLDGYSHLAAAAHRLAGAAEHFHEAVEGGADYRHAINDYVRLRQEYFHLRRDFRRAHEDHHDEHVSRDWEQLYAAFADLDDAMGG